MGEEEKRETRKRQTHQGGAQSSSSKEGFAN
jgi:hypothetical protein